MLPVLTLHDITWQSQGCTEAHADFCLAQWEPGPGLEFDVSWPNCSEHVCFYKLSHAPTWLWMSIFSWSCMWARSFFLSKQNDPPQNWSNLPVPVFSTVFHHSQRNDSYLCPYPQAWHCEEVEAWERSGCCEKGSQHEQLGRTCRWLWFCLIGIDTGIDLRIAIGIDRGTDWQLKTTWIWYLMMLDDAW